MSANRIRTRFCSSGSNMPRMRLIVWPVSIVCSVLSTRWPVSAAFRPISTVSRSRISPTRMIFGRLRKAARRPLAKVSKSLPICALVERGLLLRMHELDGVLQRDDVDGLRLVDLVEQRRQASWICPSRSRPSRGPGRSSPWRPRGRSPASSSSSRGDCRVQLAADDRVVAALGENVDAEAGLFVTA